MVVMKSTFQKIIHPMADLNDPYDYRVKDYKNLIEFLKTTWVCRPGTRVKVYYPRIEKIDGVEHFVIRPYEEPEEIKTMVPMDKIKGITISYNKLENTGKITFMCDLRDIDVNDRLMFKYGFNLDGEDHISTCILEHFFEN